VRDQPEQSSPEGIAIERLARAAGAARELSDVLWESLQEELRQPQHAQIQALSQRLVEISATVAMLAGATTAGAAPTPAPTASPDPAVGAGSVEATPKSDQSSPPFVERRRAPAPSNSPASPTPLQSIPAARGAQYTFTKLVDEREPASPPSSSSPPPPQPLASVEPIQPEIEIRDVRREEGPSAWVSSVGRLLARHAQDGLPFAVLLVEIVDVAHLERSETPHDLHGLVAQVESALGRGMRATDQLSRETLGRYWLVAPETNGTGARMLAERLARLVRTSATHRGVPMEVAIGIAVCPDDGTEAPALAARADLGVYSARATGRSIAHTDPPPAS
jgi:GGDEF domain-containing protein